MLPHNALKVSIRWCASWSALLSGCPDACGAPARHRPGGPQQFRRSAPVRAAKVVGRARPWHPNWGRGRGPYPVWKKLSVRNGAAGASAAHLEGCSIQGQPSWLRAHQDGSSHDGAHVHAAIVGAVVRQAHDGVERLPAWLNACSAISRTHRFSRRQHHSAVPTRGAEVRSGLLPAGWPIE